MFINQRNLVMLEGRLAVDPVVFQNRDGSEKWMLKLAVDRPYRKNAKDDQPTADFIAVESFVGAQQVQANQRGLLPYLAKGAAIQIMATIQTGSYTNKSGQTQYTTTIAACSIQSAMINKGAKSETNQAPAAQYQQTPQNQAQASRVPQYRNQMPQQAANTSNEMMYSYDENEFPF